MARWSAAYSLLLLLPGCGRYTIAPPLDVDRPVTVYIADLGNTSKLVLPTSDDAYVEFGFGDWEFYAKGNDFPLYAPFALIIPTPGTLSKRVYPSDPVGSIYAEALHSLDVERADAAALERRLSDLYDAHVETEINNPGFGLDFVKVDEGYWLFNQSSSKVAEWTRELGCEVSGWALIADFRVVAPRN